MYTLYARRGAGSFVVEAVLAECGRRYRRVEVQKDADGRYPAAFLRLNPLGQVPTLVLPNRNVMTESAAIVIYLADRHPRAALAPGPRSPLRTDYLRWLTFMSATVYATDLRLYYPDRYTTDPRGAEAVAAAAVVAMDREWDLLAGALGEGPWLLGKRFSAADIYAAMLATWHPDPARLFARHANAGELCERVKARPGIAPIWADNDMP